jgi:hypothetical protein
LDAMIDALAAPGPIGESDLPSCGGRLRLVAVLSDAASIVRYLSGVRLAADPPAVAAARPPPQRELDLVF